MGIERQIKTAKSALKAFNAARGKAYKGGDEADVRDLITGLCHLLSSEDRVAREEMDVAWRNFGNENFAARPLLAERRG